MTDDGNVDKRRARLQAMRERYQQQAPTDMAVTNEPVTEQWRSGLESRRGRPKREARRQQTAPQAGGGLLQRLIQFLREPSPGDTLIAGTTIGEQRLQQAVRWLEQRAKSSQGGTSERIQRLLRFLTQDIPGEPMVAGINLKRLQQLLERAEVSPEPEASSAVAAIGDAEPNQPMTERMTAADERITAVAPSAALTSASEIAALEQTLKRLRELSHDLELQLDSARRRSDLVAPDQEGSGNKPAALQQSHPASLPKSRSSASLAPAITPRSEGNDWFNEFLE